MRSKEEVRAREEQARSKIGQIVGFLAFFSHQYAAIFLKRKHLPECNKAVVVLEMSYLHV